MCNRLLGQALLNTTNFLILSGPPASRSKACELTGVFGGMLRKQLDRSMDKFAAKLVVGFLTLQFLLGRLRAFAPSRFHGNR